MWSSQPKNPENGVAARTRTPELMPVPQPRSRAILVDQSAIGKNITIKGVITGAEALHIDGKIEGTIELAGNRVTVGHDGLVTADIRASEILVMGNVRGNLTASNSLQIQSSGSMVGDVLANRISIEDGAYVHGSVDIGASVSVAKASATATEHKATLSALAVGQD
jgi:cytoskeletal protein CcmA (bactofilin family)